MKVILKDDDVFIFRFDKGDEFITSLKNFCIKNSVKAATFSAIGATDDCVVAYYDSALNKYIDKRYFGKNMEVVSLLGNISVYNNQPIIHAHGVVADSDNRAIAGHVRELKVSVTCEVSLQVLNGEIKRVPIAGTELFLMD